MAVVLTVSRETVPFLSFFCWQCIHIHACLQPVFARCALHHDRSCKTDPAWDDGQMTQAQQRESFAACDAAGPSARDCYSAWRTRVTPINNIVPVNLTKFPSTHANWIIIKAHPSYVLHPCKRIDLISIDGIFNRKGYAIVRCNWTMMLIKRYNIN